MPHNFSTNDSLGLSTGKKTTLRATQPAAIKWQSNFLFKTTLIAAAVA